jgi:hypothetical protein
MSEPKQWYILLRDGTGVPIAVGEVDSYRTDIRAAEDAASQSRRTLVFVKLMTDVNNPQGGVYHCPLRFLNRFSGYLALPAGAERNFMLYKCPGYPEDRRRKYPSLPSAAAVDFDDGTIPL